MVYEVGMGKENTIPWVKAMMDILGSIEGDSNLRSYGSSTPSSVCDNFSYSGGERILFFFKDPEKVYFQDEFLRIFSGWG